MFKLSVCFGCPFLHMGAGSPVRIWEPRMLMYALAIAGC